MYYLILEKLTPVSLTDCLNNKHPYVAILTPEEWRRHHDLFDMDIDMEFNIDVANSTKAEVNSDSLTGTFKIPDRRDLLGQAMDFSFALDERGVVFIDEHRHVADWLAQIQSSKKWKTPSLERFLYDFLETIIHGDLTLLEDFDNQLDKLEETILTDKGMISQVQLNLIRRQLTKLNLHYGQLIDLAQEFYENENNFFAEENLRFFHLFSSRVTRLQTSVVTLRETLIQIRELAQSQLETKQNKIMSVLTIVTTCCMPLTILVGWYGMNFKYMPELSSPLGYPAVIGFAILIFVSAIAFFKYKKWL